MFRRRKRIVIILLCFCMALMPLCVGAASTSDAKEPISTDNECSLTVYCRNGEVVFSDISVRLYKISEVSSDYQYSLSDAFSDSGLVLNGIQTVGEWNVVRSTLETHILVNEINADFISETDQNGQACFTALKTGLYLVITDQAEQGDLRCSFTSALISLPSLSDDGVWQYQVEAAPKSEEKPPVDTDEEIELKVLKLWKGDNEEERPKSIEIEIFRDGKIYQTVVLSEENHWSYSWSAKDDGAEWKVAERNIPSGYSLTVEEREFSFVLTNTFVSENPEKPPQTGDTSNMLFYIILMTVSGFVLVIVGRTGKRKQL